MYCPAFPLNRTSCVFYWKYRHLRGHSCNCTVVSVDGDIHVEGTLSCYLYVLKPPLGLVRDLNPGPLAPEARIIPLDQRAIGLDELCNITFFPGEGFPQLYETKDWARPGFEPGTSRTQSENHTPRPTSQLIFKT